MATNIDDLSDMLLVEILCRLSCDKFVLQSQCVSKRWRTLISDSYFIGHFLRIQSHKQTPETHVVVDINGNELFPTQDFERFRSFLSSKKESHVLATCNDLVLCSEKQNDRDYYICNPRTMQLVTLPPTSRCHQLQPLGFICEPYYYEASNAGLNINAEYRCKVVRILGPKTRNKCLKFNIQVFSTETGEWREIVVPCPQGFKFFDIRCWASFGNNGNLYWVAQGSLLALRTPLVINNKINGTSTNGGDIVDDDDQYQFHVIEIDLPPNHSFYNPAAGTYSCQLHYIGVYGGRVRLQDCNLDEEPPLLCVWELKEEELDQMVVDGTRKLGSEHKKSYSLDRHMFPEDSYSVYYIAYDLNDLDVVYASVGEDTVQCNIRTGSWSKMAKTSFVGSGYQLVLPRWPTPVPRLPQAQYDELFS